MQKSKNFHIKSLLFLHYVIFEGGKVIIGMRIWCI